MPHALSAHRSPRRISPLRAAASATATTTGLAILMLALQPALAHHEDQQSQRSQHTQNPSTERRN
jgi:hypothetical protein